MNKNRLIMVISSIVLLLGLITLPFASACGPAQPEKAEPIKIGVLLPYTGVNADMLPWMENAAKLASYEVGEEVAGRPIEILLGDSASDIAPSLDKARKLVEEDKVHVLIGPIMSHVASAVRAYSAESGIPYLYIAGSLLEDLTENPVKNAFMHFGTMRGIGFHLGMYAHDEMGAKTATVIHDDFVAGEDLTQGCMDAFVNSGGTVIQRQRTPMDSMEYAPYITAMKEADVCMFWFVPFHALRFASQYHEYGLEMPLVVAGDLTVSEISMLELGDKCLGMMGNHCYLPRIDTPATRAYVDRWVQQYGHLGEEQGNFPRLNEGNSTYVSVRLAIEAIKTTDGDTSSEILNEALRNIKWESPWGMLSFTDYGLGIGDWFIVEATKDGDTYYWKVIHTYKQIERYEPEHLIGVAPKL